MAVGSPSANTLSASVTSAKITEVERILLYVPFVERIRLEMERARIHAWGEVEVIRVVTDAGIVGYGERSRTIPGAASTWRNG